MSNLPDDFMFSQSSLQDYVDCPRRFELKYLLKQRFPAPEVDDMLEFERRMEQGERFHKLVHQHLLGIPTDLLKQRIQDNELAEWFNNYLETGLGDVPEQRYPEKTLTIPIGDYGLLAKVDLLAIDADTVKIIDWKTSRHIPKPDKLQSRWQTRVYLYVVTKGANYLTNSEQIAPNTVEMIYWYANHDGTTRRFAYSQAQFEQAEQDLLQLINDIDNTTVFPLTSDERRCRFCTYRSLCDRGETAGALD
ncbi:MAG: PD-(D/E)XK nuclease family protein, partial [Chloroflexota bacterium]